MFDSPFDLPLAAEDEKLERWWLTGLLHGFALNCIVACVFFVFVWRISDDVNWWIVGGVSTSLFVFAFAHAAVAGLFGRRRAWFVFTGLLLFSLVGLLTWVAWYVSEL